MFAASPWYSIADFINIILAHGWRELSLFSRTKLKRSTEIFQASFLSRNGKKWWNDGSWAKSKFLRTFRIEFFMSKSGAAAMKARMGPNCHQVLSDGQGAKLRKKAWVLRKMSAGKRAVLTTSFSQTSAQSTWKIMANWVSTANGSRQS